MSKTTDIFFGKKKLPPKQSLAVRAELLKGGWDTNYMETMLLSGTKINCAKQITDMHLKGSYEHLWNLYRFLKDNETEIIGTTF